MVSAHEATPVYELRSVSRVYTSGSVQVHAVRDADLTIGAGESLAIVGSSGSGKTTLLQLLGALDRPTSGELLFEGRDVGALGDQALSELRLDGPGLRVPAVQPDPDPHSSTERRGRARPDRRRRAGCDASACTRCSRRWVSPIAPTTSRESCPVASSSGSRSQGRLRTIRTSCLRTSRQATSTRKPEPRSSISSSPCRATTCGARSSS